VQGLHSRLFPLLLLPPVIAVAVAAAVAAERERGQGSDIGGVVKGKVGLLDLSGEGGREGGRGTHRLHVQGHDLGQLQHNALRAEDPAEMEEEGAALHQPEELLERKGKREAEGKRERESGG